MEVEPHHLHHEFPQYSDKIHQLKVSDAQFAKLFEEYHDRDREIRRAEQGVEHLGDAKLEELKLRRVHLKDQLFHRLQAA